MLSSSCAPSAGGRWSADEEEQHDVISAHLSWHEKRRGFEHPHGRVHYAFLCVGRRRGQVGLVECSTVGWAAACFLGVKQNTGSGFLD